MATRTMLGPSGSLLIIALVALSASEAACGGSAPAARDSSAKPASSVMPAGDGADAPAGPWTRFTSADAHFSVLFPAKPEEATLQDSGPPLRIWAVKSPGHPAAFSVIVRDWAPKGDVAAAMHDVATALTSAKACGGKIAKEAKKEDGARTAIRFISDCGESGAIAGEIHFDGQRLYVVEIMIQDESLPGEDIKQFFGSFAMNP
jgi:hypothetical protein